MALIDTHFHLDLHKKDVEIAEEIENIKIYTIAVTNTPSVFEHTEKLTKGKMYLRCALGLHPELSVSRKNELPLFKQFLKRTRYIGEVGLDYSNSTKQEINVQNEIFKQIIEWCSFEENKILSVHSRKAEKSVLDIIGNSFKGEVIMHYYSGPIKEMERAINNGYYFSVNYTMTQTQNGRKIISRIPPDRLLTESDAPFISMSTNNENQISTILELLSSQLAINRKNLEEQIFSNFRRILS